jgi:hypothetical protein
MQATAVLHANEIQVSEAQLHDDVRTIKGEHEARGGYRSAVISARALAQAETRHWRRCLESAGKNGANPQFFLAQLNRWNPDGSPGQIGDLSGAP